MTTEVFPSFVLSKGIKYSRGGTRTDRALILANTGLYSAQGGYRDNLPNVLFVLTDGKTNRGSKPYSIVLGPLLVRTLVNTFFFSEVYMYACVTLFERHFASNCAKAQFQRRTSHEQNLIPLRLTKYRQIALRRHIKTI